LTESAFGSKPRTAQSEVKAGQEPQGSLDKAGPTLAVTKRRNKASYSTGPRWAVTNWDNLEARYRASRATGAVRKRLKAAKDADLSNLGERLQSAQLHYQERVERDAVRDRARERAADDFERYKAALEAFHSREIEAIAGEVAAEARPASRRDPYSRRSLKATLSPTEQRTWEAVRKILTRPSKGTGKRKRGPSLEALAVQVLFKRNKRIGILIRRLILEGERLPAIAHQQGTTPQALMKQFRHALASVQKAIDGAKTQRRTTHKCPQKPPFIG
jgi:hypothetical protein